MPNQTCIRCGHTWASLQERPKVCPRCKSYVFDKPYKRVPPVKKEEAK